MARCFFDGVAVVVFFFVARCFLKFLKWRAEENLVVNNKDNRVFMSRNYRSDSCPLEI